MLWIWFGLDGTGVQESVSCARDWSMTSANLRHPGGLPLAPRADLDGHIRFSWQHSILDYPSIDAVKHLRHHRGQRDG